MTGICVISARGGSQGVPGKNIRPLLGKPLIQWSIEHALAASEIDRVVVSTDSPAIAEVARAAGAEVPFMRPAELATSSAGKFGVWQHALRTCETHFGETYEFYLDLDCTSPLRDVEDISKAVAQFREARSRGIDAVFSVCEARKNPYFNMVEKDPDGFLTVCKKGADGNWLIRRQDAPTVYEHVGSIYVLSPDYLKSNATYLLDGRTEGYLIAPEKGFDVDTPVDFEMVEFFLRRKLDRLHEPS